MCDGCQTAKSYQKMSENMSDANRGLERQKTLSMDKEIPKITIGKKEVLLLNSASGSEARLKGRIVPMMNYIAIFFLGFFLGFFIGLLLAFVACRSDLYISWGDRLTEAQERALHRLGFKI